MLVLVHIGDHFPSYINECIEKVNSVSDTPIHVLLDRKHIPLLRGRVTPFPLDGIHMDELHARFESMSILNDYMRGGFWKFATKRFFYLYTHMKQQGLTDVFHIENDILIYMDFTEKLSLFQQKDMWCVLDSEERCIPSFVYIKNETILEKLLHTCIECSSKGLNDMQALAKFAQQNSTVGCLPIITNYCSPLSEKFYQHAEAFGCLFDGACVGQYIGGVDPRNNPGDTRGFINETTVFQCDKVTIEWREGKPWLNSLPLMNLHIHSKDLARWMNITYK